MRTSTEPRRQDLFLRSTLDLLDGLETEERSRLDEIEQGIAGPEDIQVQMRRDALAGNTGADRFRLYAEASTILETGPNSVELLDMWHAAQAWAHDLRGHLYIAEDDVGRSQRFISERGAGLQLALGQMGTELRFDVRAQVPQIRDRRGVWHEFNDRIEATIRDTIAGLYCFARQSNKKSGGIRAVPAAWSNASWGVVRDALLAENSVDTFLAWLQQLPEWDGEPRLVEWLYSVGFTFEFEEGDPLLDAKDRVIDWACTSIPLLACKRALHPGLKHDTIPVLVGPQGTGKSTCLSWLMPPEYREEWFTDGLRLSADEKRRIEALQGAVIVEVAEMSGATAADIESLKAFLSRTNDRARLAYRRNPEPHPRRCSIVGTANGTAILPNDSSGNRRFAVLRVVDGNAEDVRMWLDANREQLWAEAWFRARDGEECFFPPDLAGAQSDINEAFRSADVVMEEELGHWLRWRARSGDPHFTLREAAEGAKIVSPGDGPSVVQLSRGEINRIARALEAAGCTATRKYVDGQRQRVWLFPGA